MDPLWHALLQSLRIASLATLGAGIVAIPVAYLLARRQFPGKAIAETLLTMPLVLPPTVVGYFLLVLLGHNGLLSHPFHFSIIWTWYGAAVAAGVVAFPLLLMPARASFEGVDKELEDVSRLMGANRFQVFWHISLPLAGRGIASGFLIAFARALGEFGATVMVLGIRDTTRTLPIFVYDEFEDLHPAGLVPAVLLLSGVTLVVLVLYSRLFRPEPKKS
ncbi:MAG TPA: molybdate ABC transporter permease subunit [Tepidisphaeraceae bacterium]|jgi:molybdate transport system permease protein|nr:molybdate ABC transporter permease subunit [Tepidisphaeraceae bacterium]